MGFGPISHANGTRVQAASVCQFQHRGTNKALKAGAVTPVTVSPVPALFGPISAALKPSTFSVLPIKLCNRPPLIFLGLICLSCSRYIQSEHLLSGAQSIPLDSPYGSSVYFGHSLHVLLNYSCPKRRIVAIFIIQSTLNGRNPLVAKYLALIVLDGLGLALILKSFQAIVNRCERLTVFRELKSEIQQAVAYFRGSESSVSVLLKHHTDSISELYRLSSGFAFNESRDFDIGRVFLIFVGADRAQAVHQLFPVNNLNIDRLAVSVDLSAGCDKLIEFLSRNHESFF